MRIAIGVSYGGEGLEGWQSQPSRNTVQDHLERALAKIAGEPVRVQGAGRTDAGVHALAQVAHFDTASARPDSAWVRGTNAYLPPRIAVQWSLPVSEEFSARYSAQSRRYVYLLYCNEVRPAMLAHKVGWYRSPLDIDAMRQAAQCLEGKHDFSAFRSSQCQAKSPFRSITRIAIDAAGAAGSPAVSCYVRFDITADGFLHHMVRNLVGCLLYVGNRRQPAAWLSDVLESRDRSRGAPTLDAAGLYLAQVSYAAHWRLPPFPRIMPFLLT